MLAKKSENSDVSTGLSDASSLVAVAVMTPWPAGTGNEIGPNGAMHDASVVLLTAPKNVCPSPWPKGSPCALEKNSRRNVMLGRLSSVPEIVTMPPPKDTDV